MADKGQHSHHVTPIPKLAATFVALLVLMVVTIFAAYGFPPGTLSTAIMNVIAMAIALVKAYLVVSIFMGVRTGTKLVKLYAIGGFGFFLLLFVTLADYMTRPLEPVPGWEGKAASGLPRDGGNLNEFRPDGTRQAP